MKVLGGKTKWEYLMVNWLLYHVFNLEGIDFMHNNREKKLNCWFSGVLF